MCGNIGHVYGPRYLARSVRNGAISAQLWVFGSRAPGVRSAQRRNDCARVRAESLPGSMRGLSSPVRNGAISGCLLGAWARVGLWDLVVRNGAISAHAWRT